MKAKSAFNFDVGTLPNARAESLHSLTRFQLAALVVIHAHVERYGSGPLLRELAEQLGLFSKSTARRHVLRLEEAGMVTYERVGRLQQMAARTLRPTERGRSVVERWQTLRDSATPSGKYTLSLGEKELAAARRAGLPLQALPTAIHNGRTLVRFEDRAERDFWATLILEDLESNK